MEDKGDADAAAAAERVRLAVYRGFADTGRAPTRDALAAAAGLSAEAVEGALATLARARHVVLDSAGEIVMAHPVASIDPVSAVLEIAGGRAAELGIREGDKVDWPR